MSFAKNKYTEPEAYKPQHGYRSPSSDNRRSYRRSGSSPGRVVLQPEKEQPLAVTMRQQWLRLKRSLVALRFQANRYTLGAFRKRAIVKIGFLTFAVHFLFFSEEGPQIMSTTPKLSEQGVVVPIETEPVGDLAKPKAKPAKTKTKGEAAPVDASEMMSEQAQDYVERFHGIAVKEMNKYGIPASISLAQGLVESRAGTSKLAVQNNNHFGIKCFSRNCKKGHCTNFTDDTHKDFFRKFKNPWDSWRAHSLLLASGSYAKLKKHGRDYRKWAYGLKAVGYATDRNYAEKLIGIIERYELYKYDR